MLVSQDNAGTAEAIAGTLRDQLHALIIGQKTSGRAVEYEHYPIGDNLVLTVAIKELVIPGAPPIFPNGLTPDIAVPFPKQQQDAVLALADQNGVSDYIFDEERPHTNEAALVAGKNPDLDAYEADHANGKSKRTTCQRPGPAAGNRFFDGHQRFPGQVRGDWRRIFNHRFHRLHRLKRG